MLSPKALALIHDYFNLPFAGISGVRCPYVNNAKLKQRGQLRVLVGKGLPSEIVEEAHIISVQFHAGLFEKDGRCCLHNKHTGAPTNAEDIRTFLIEHHLGIECSGFVTQVLRAHYRETKNIDITKKLFIVSPRRVIRWLISKLRPIENMDVRVYTNDRNSLVIADSKIGWNYAAVQSGDIITLREAGPRKNRNHILLITENSGNTLSYVHARQWPSEGRYGHGVAAGTIAITAPGKTVAEQSWKENGVSGPLNETQQEVASANSVEIRRLRV